MDVDPSDASMLSSLVASGISYLSINLVLKRFRIFQIGDTSSDYSVKDQASDPQRQQRGLTWTRKEILSKFVAQGIHMLLE